MRQKEAEALDGIADLSRRCRPGLMAFFLRRLPNHAEAEDLTQEVFMRLAALPSDSVANAEAYIFQIAANLLRDRARREKVRFEHREGVRATEDHGVERLDPARIAQGREAVAQIASVLKELPERTRTIFVLYRLEAMNKRAIAEGLGISVSAVDKHLMRATARLMDRLGSPR
ncbi:RNA polymerase sigma factor [Brevundimonas staleyi]|uniref:RNA polymerase sigma factor n=1 Tax=Brevundimonas staleyi TaxID=74326 RepID=A0ABW0FVK9_9CAUL